jgi:hypothetical protein
LTDFILALLEDNFYPGRNTPLSFFVPVPSFIDTIRADAEVFRSRTLYLSFLNPRVLRIQTRAPHGKGNILDLSADLAAEVTVLLGDRIEALLPRARDKAVNDALGGHEFQVSIHGSEADPGKSSPHQLVHFVGAGVISAETDFLQNSGPLLGFSQID